MSEREQSRIVFAGRHLSMMERGGWEFVTRNTSSPAVGIVAITDDDRVVLVEQHRAPVGCNVIELPAGLSGDTPGTDGEALLDAAKRELWEETGYRGAHWTQLGLCYSSPGLTDESIMLFLAEGLSKQAEAHGDETESITVHEVPINRVMEWLNEQNAVADLKLLAGLFAVRNLRTAKYHLS